MTLSGPLLTSFQRCPRRWRIEQDWAPVRHNPGRLFRELWAEAILRLSQGEEVEAVVEEAQTRFMELAARPGLDTLADPYTLVGDYCAALETSLEAISRLSWTELYGPIGYGDGWKFSCWKFMRGEGTSLERWVAVERWTPSRQAQELHSWSVVGDMAQSGLPLNLHVVELGAQRGGHLHGVWTRTFSHPVIAHQHKFQHTDGRRLGSGWKPVWFASGDNNAATWVDLQERDGVRAIRHLSLKALEKEAAAEVLDQILFIKRHMDRTIGDWNYFPMSRGACDIPYLCPWQEVCYQPFPQVVRVEDIGGYKRKA